MGEAARRKRQGFDGRRMGEAVLAALNQDAGGNVWGLVKGTATPAEFIVLGAESPEVRTAFITNAEAADTPHRVVGQVLMRRGEGIRPSATCRESSEVRHEASNNIHPPTTSRAFAGSL